MIKRQLEKVILFGLNQGKAIILLGPRQSGKTTLMEAIASKHTKYLLLDCDDPFVRNQLENANTEELKQIISDYKLVFIDEAQRVKNIGLTLKIITDRLKNVQLLVSGSSSFEISNQTNEPLTGRKWEHILYPISWVELQLHIGFLKTHQQLEHRIIYGMYPDVINFQGKEQKVLKNLSSSYLYKDIFNFKGLRRPDLLEKLLQLLALQLGNEVSYNYLAKILQVDKNTISNYLQLLEQAFVIFRLKAFSRNKKNEIKRGRKIYFYDTGIRNSIIGDFKPLDLRQDKGALWENFLISERRKQLEYQEKIVNTYFWRTVSGQEIDYIEERDGQLFPIEFKWEDTYSKHSKAFFKLYETEVKVVNQSNFEKFIKGEL
jgi:predicted AAA+ superfamily ATPase